MTGQHEKAKLAISKIYNTGSDKTKLENIFKAESAALGAPGDQDGEEGTGNVTMAQALCTNEKYTRSSWTAISIMAFQCLTGYYAIIAYSEVLLRDNFGEDASLTTR